jgi:hypothetical protein
LNALKFSKKLLSNVWLFKIPCYLCPCLFREVKQTQGGDIAQLVEQWTENPCVGGSNPSITTKENQAQMCLVFLLDKTEACFMLKNNKKNNIFRHLGFLVFLLSKVED